MPNYKVRYKLKAESDSRCWLVGPHPDKETALAWFNSGDATKEGLGQFEFDPDGPTATDYYLVEGNEEQFFHLKKITPSDAFAAAITFSITGA